MDDKTFLILLIGLMYYRSFYVVVDDEWWCLYSGRRGGGGGGGAGISDTYWCYLSSQLRLSGKCLCLFFFFSFYRF